MRVEIHTAAEDVRDHQSHAARAALEALLWQAEDPGNPRMKREFLVSTSLVVRGSTAAPPSSVR